MRKVYYILSTGQRTGSYRKALADSEFSLLPIETVLVPAKEPCHTINEIREIARKRRAAGRESETQKEEIP